VRVGLVELAADEPAFSASFNGDVAWHATPPELTRVLTQRPVDAIVFHVGVDDRDRLLEMIEHAKSLRPSIKLLLATTSHDVVMVAEISSVLLRPGLLPIRPSLTARENQVLEGIGSGRTNKEIAGWLGISLSTVNRHIENVLKKLSVRNRAQAVAVAVDLGYRAEPHVRDGRGAV
jgi:DNA-binding CsgD family transcriptional regulator